MRWQGVFYFILCLLTLPARADMLSSIVLGEAQQLVEIEPERAKYLAKNYLTQRQLSDAGEQSAASISREEADRTLRTPNGSVEAYRTLAQAEYTEGNIEQAMRYLARAQALAEKYKLYYLSLDLRLLHNELSWRHDKNYVRAQEELDAVEADLSSVNSQIKLTKTTRYRVLMQRAQLAAALNTPLAALDFFTQAKALLNPKQTDRTWIDYRVVLGQFYLGQKRYNAALSELLYAYWTAIEIDDGARLAKVNRQLADLFQERHVLDKALEYASQAADYYATYPNSPILAQVMEQMGKIYYQQGKYNLALVHYFNVLDHASTDRDLQQAIAIRQQLAATYLQLFNFPLAEKYLQRADELLEFADFPEQQAEAALLKSGIAYFKHDAADVISYAQSALNILDRLNDHSSFDRQSAYRLLALGHEQDGNTTLALENLRHYYTIVNQEQGVRNHISEEAFREQKAFAEQSLYFASQTTELGEVKQEYTKTRRIAFGLFLLTVMLFLMWIRKGVVSARQQIKIESLSRELYTHSRSKLRNLRMLNAKLSSSLRKANENFELWQQGELIHEPLNDRLRFAMIDLPFLRSTYIKHGYKSGLELERAFGAMLKQKMESPARLYHFSDANLLYIEPSSWSDNSAEGLFHKIQQWVNDFAKEHAISPIVRMGIADYPFLPRAYTAVNDQELLDLLLLATHIAREVSLSNKTSQWVHFKAIDNAPAASLTNGDIRSACKIAISQGLIKIHSSCQNEDQLKKILKNDEHY
ncbi:tetratricopeptide repeat protein [Vibrio sp. SM6]|uniref:Tetratricopeptide repeat protein n=1 Tax=Vibrio agarilyticus TaxID=2726741 RepID=A0A7X8TSM9_9VIBR|nr:tetratricopeptide repeat protein [Vibrio agarilyticus]NLS14150.1 tetratricopeptide repeat protein [Vibrio agarilyticus]